MNRNLLKTCLALIAPLMNPALHAATFGDDTSFLKEHTEVIVLSDKAGLAKVSLAPAWQGRVMSSASEGDSGLSYGWINRDLISSGKTVPHMNALGGEDRFWMGPEGGQFSVFFEKGVPFDFEHWFTPAIFDTLPFKLISKDSDRAIFGAQFELTNYSGTKFQVSVKRTVQMLDSDDAWKVLGVPPASDVSVVAYETDNQVTNAGKDAWKKETGLLSIWILGQYNPSSAATIVAPIKAGPESDLGVKVTSNYFGAVPSERLKVKDSVVFLSADGKYRSKIGLNPMRSKGILGSYDSANNVLTIVTFNQPEGVKEYVNSLWKLQDNPYGGDAANAYNDGPATPGAKPMGPFFELESSSPAAALAPGENIVHVRRTIHLSGPKPALDAVSKATLGVSLADIEGAFKAE
ncbi:MAG TPA: DUF6786 family protein [Opitutaceae bacterium]|jgi:hypothetical protein|nr:DUF6786 family protein [Opitutaceae bacterium]